MQLRGGISEEEICNVLLELAIENQEDWSDSTWEAWAEDYENHSCYFHNNKPN